MIQPMRIKSLLWQSIVFGVVVASSAARADVIVAATVTPVGGLFHYDYAITNEPPLPGNDVIFVDIVVLPLDATLTNLFAPAGFQAVYDSGLGRVSFLPDLDGFALFEVGVTHSGFGFDSAVPAAASTFEALTLFGDFVSGPTLAPVGDTTTIIPEPATVSLLLAGLGSLAAFRARRRDR